MALGCGRDGQVFGGSGLSLMKVQLSMRDSLAKIEDGIKFFARGIRLFGSDIGNSGRLVVFAATGANPTRLETYLPHNLIQGAKIGLNSVF